MTTYAPGTSPAPVSPASVKPAAASGLRTDIQALRALAVGVVILYHLWPNRVPGGYVGVDVFFVISGFLISSHLLGELNSSGRVRLAAFWARRAKRLIPASAIVLVASGIATVVWVPRRLWPQFLDEVVASALQFQNWLLAHDSVDYLAANNPPSPTQHFWTLSVEEQFYVGLPLLLLATAVVGRRGLRAARRRRAVIGLLLLAVAVGSFGYGVRLTDADPSLAYFSTFTRAWEFALGALLALALTGAPTGHRARHSVDAGHARGPGEVVAANIVALVGIAAIVVACFAYSAATPFPGVAAGLPVLGTLCVLWRANHTVVARVGAWAPIALVGRVSYAAYLWHWPILVILPYATGHALSAKDKLAVIVVALAVSWASTRFVEDPVRFSPRLLGRRRPRVVAACCAVPVVLVVGLAFVVQRSESQHEQNLAREAHLALQNSPHCFGAQALDPALAPCHNPALTGKIFPDSTAAHHDDASNPKCWADVDGTPNVCHLGPATGYTKRLLALGDSHNNALDDVYGGIAEQNNWRIDTASKQSCYLTTARRDPSTDVLADACRKWNRGVTTIAKTGHYDAIIVTHAGFGPRVVPENGRSVEQTTVDGLVAAWKGLPDVPIVAIRDNPTVRADSLNCVDKYPKAEAIRKCTTPKSVGLKFDGQALAAKQVGRQVRVVDFTSLYCNPTDCPEVVGNALVYRDDSHLTKTYTHTITPYVNDKLSAVLADAWAG